MKARKDTWRYFAEKISQGLIHHLPHIITDFFTYELFSINLHLLKGFDYIGSLSFLYDVIVF
ncbi:MAG: hypothetical protein R2784_10475 [Saprospiraceae bacterium]